MKALKPGVVVVVGLLVCCTPGAPGGAPGGEQRTQASPTVSLLPKAEPAQGSRLPANSVGKWRITSWAPSSVGTLGAEDGRRFIGKTLELLPEAASFDSVRCDTPRFSPMEAPDFWGKVKRCGTEYHPDWDCRSIGEAGDLALKCLGDTARATPTKLQVLGCSQGFPDDLLLLSQGRMIAFLADGRGVVCLSRLHD
jgi:hypothetical protein